MHHGVQRTFSVTLKDPIQFTYPSLPKNGVETDPVPLEGADAPYRLWHRVFTELHECDAHIHFYRVKSRSLSRASSLYRRGRNSLPPLRKILPHVRRSLCRSSLAKMPKLSFLPAVMLPLLLLLGQTMGNEEKRSEPVSEVVPRSLFQDGFCAIGQTLDQVMGSCYYGYNCGGGCAPYQNVSFPIGTRSQRRPRSPPNSLLLRLAPGWHGRLYGRGRPRLCLPPARQVSVCW